MSRTIAERIEWRAHALIHEALVRLDRDIAKAEAHLEDTRARRDALILIKASGVGDLPAEELDALRKALIIYGRSCKR